MPDSLLGATIINKKKFVEVFEPIVLKHAPNPVNPLQDSTLIYDPKGLNFPESNDETAGAILNDVLNEAADALKLGNLTKFMDKVGEPPLETEKPVNYGDLKNDGFFYLVQYGEKAMRRIVSKASGLPVTFDYGKKTPWNDAVGLGNFIANAENGCQLLVFGQIKFNDTTQKAIEDAKDMKAVCEAIIKALNAHFEK